MDGPTLVGLTAVGAAAIWFALKPPAVFVVHIRDGKAKAKRGVVTSAFQFVIAELCQQYGITRGEIRGLAQGKRIRLWFSRALPQGFRQQLRNWWMISGWPAKP